MGPTNTYILNYFLYINLFQDFLKEKPNFSDLFVSFGLYSKREF